MRVGPALLAAFVLLHVAPAHAAEDPESLAPKDPEGVTFDWSLGLGVTQTSSFIAFGFGTFISDDVEFAVMLPAFSVGGWAASKVSLGGRLSNFWYVPDDEEIVNGYIGFEVRYLPVPEFFVAYGLGLQLVGETFEGDADAGVGSDLRAAVLPLESDGHRFGFFAEVVPGFVDEEFTYSAGGGIVWFVP